MNNATWNSIQKTSLGVSEVMDKIKDGKGSLLSKTLKMNKIGGLTPKNCLLVMLKMIKIK